LLPNSSFGLVTTNAAQSDLTGLELDFTVKPVEGLLLRAGYAYLDAEYDKFIFDATTDFSGNRMLRSPEHSYNLTFDYVWPVGAGEASVRFDWSWQDEIFFEFDEGATTGTRQGSFGLLSGEIGYYGLNNWRLAVWAKNLTDEVYRNSVLNFGGNTIEFLGLPRTYGIRVGYAFQ
jgi:iron complex outermembrane receptor protein